MKYLNISIITIGIFFILLNYYALTEMTYESARLIRVLGTASFTLLAIINRSSRKLIVFLIFLLLLLSDLALLNYESPANKIFQFIMRGCSYLLISSLIFKSLHDLKINLFQKISLSLIFGINIFLLYSIADTFQEEIENLFITFLFYFQGITAIGMLLMAALFLSEVGDKKSIAFFLAACGFVLTDLAAFSAYHLNFMEFFLVDRIFYLISLGSLLIFISINNKPIR